MSRFVSGGTNEEPTERDAEWLKAQQQLDAKRVEEAERAKQMGGSSLYETLQANKAAKQEKFEESIRLKNQFRNLDEDEVEFLDSVLESTRAKEAAIKKDMSEQLDSFRKLQEEAEKATKQVGPEDETGSREVWSSAPRKRKKARDDAFSGLKLRRTSTGPKETSGEVGLNAEPKQDLPKASGPEQKASVTHGDQKSTSVTATMPKESSPPALVAPTNALGLGLGGYSSDEDD